ncbi:hypothetical protein CHS0354_022889 [Potamilus streckersoni]|uniref:Myogenesis-regulating glycosidase n=1 Tax=Potamilus streckersoni TaxID=2493646 RepID=A0AAE0VMY9_9BIVA|nr:hypothetical protein CHS0354_022889 [Potamilus streckersoni]
MEGRKKSGRCMIVIVVSVLFILAVTTGIIVWQVAYRTSNNTQTPAGVDSKIGNARLYYSPDNNRSLIFMVTSGKGELSGNLWAVGGSGTPIRCVKKTLYEECLEWEKDRRLRITYIEHVQPKLNCYEIEWSTLQCQTQVLMDCYDLGGAHWYGGYEDRFQPWPLDGTSRPASAYVTMDSYINQIGGVQERYFFNSNGTGFFIPDEIPLYVSINESQDGRFCLMAKHEISPYHNVDGLLPNLRYNVCSGLNVLDIHRKMSALFISKPSDIPDKRLFRYPIWSTWAQYHKDINQSIVNTFAHAIQRNNFSHSQLEIDDDWTPKYGDMVFNESKFPNASEMIKSLSKLGFRTTIWVHPFFNIDSKAFVEASNQSFLIRQYGSELPALVSWWDTSLARGEMAGILDTTNPMAVQWFLSKLRYLRKEYNISSFKFDAGEVRWLPKIYNALATPLNPNIYTQQWARLAYESDKDVRHQEVRVGYRTQDIPIFVRMLDKESNWDNNNGLKTLIPTALTFGVLGYPFILPDMIGGNAYDGYPDPELFIRWLQATVFMPSLQFSIVPWQFNETILKISQKFVKLHEQYADDIINLARECVITGAPIVRPLWWVDPDDEVALTCDSEFLVGDHILVAPVLDKNARSRDIYLPTGWWRDEIRGVNLTGKQWIRGFKAELNELPYFIKLPNP